MQWQHHMHPKFFTDFFQIKNNKWTADDSNIKKLCVPPNIRQLIKKWHCEINCYAQHPYAVLYYNGGDPWALHISLSLSMPPEAFQIKRGRVLQSKATTSYSLQGSQMSHADARPAALGSPYDAEPTRYLLNFKKTIRNFRNEVPFMPR